MPIYEYSCNKCGKTFDFFRHMWEEPTVNCICGGEATQLLSCFQTDKDKLFEFTDIHTTGKPIKFTSKRQWENHLKQTGKYQLTHGDIKRMKEFPEKKSDYKGVAETAWRERNKFVMDVKYGRRKLGNG